MTDVLSSIVRHILTVLVDSAANLAASVYDPRVWIALIGALVLGYSLQRWWTLLLLGGAIMTLEIALRGYFYFSRGVELVIHGPRYGSGLVIPIVAAVWWVGPRLRLQMRAQRP